MLNVETLTNRIMELVNSEKKECYNKYLLCASGKEEKTRKIKDIKSYT